MEVQEEGIDILNIREGDFVCLCEIFISHTHELKHTEVIVECAPQYESMAIENQKVLSLHANKKEVCRDFVRCP